ncbi:MBL fold metallo-hydrolase [Streptomyces sp. NBC_00102]|uniref:MBL fold metallo-hydrolase n=1 Tax=Streptomyces sp. NBC_00102 TaxID=2975652 RepID=UPI0022591C81|nr:MBL fold metallo-hydrolase [Streptomyces sp. NBC_00102]MCX5396955.1 MBL fold metallo-hydrolase [Streptomyces sp. NBC_00102]
MDLSWEELGWERLGHGVGRRRLPGWDATAALVAGADRALVVDTGASLREGVGLRIEAQRLLGRRVTHVALTHPHFDHVFGTAAFAGTEVFGAYGAAALMRRSVDEMHADAVRNGLPEHDAAEAVDALVLPGREVCHRWTLGLGGGREVVLANVGPGHTGHDLAVLVPGAGAPGARAVVLCGDLIEESGEPQTGPDSVPARWPAALDRLLALGGEDALYVPGHGEAVDAAFVRAQRELLAERFRVG